MATLQTILPDDVIKDFKKLERNTEQIIGEMTRAGAEVVLNNAKSTVPLPEMAGYVKLSKTYKTPSDGGINTKVYFSGYLPFKGNRNTFSTKYKETRYITTKGVPVDFLAKIYEYGRSTRPFPKKPFFRKSFRKNQIEAAMLKAQKRASGGLLDE